ncbi:uncharacterized protein BDZ99DRAFT_298641 [Mytilinidion resinicola]|uniref:Uncharacterized protein n=1 Tax=Mytilinidion resinicola TaxID=574789 RepID=A0A6A6YTB6_9PEZI|nr:uncharacterized protein BDZ99DRAFT_298641 [Mytilinidion resinicola]KAF2811274.1 hypothetical protein BDZ99DRAFT_298641 [Mytilinidion resinicola]
MGKYSSRLHRSFLLFAHLLHHRHLARAVVRAIGSCITRPRKGPTASIFSFWDWFDRMIGAEAHVVHPQHSPEESSWARKGRISCICKGLFQFIFLLWVLLLVINVVKTGVNSS